MIINFEGKKVEIFEGANPDACVDEICAIMGLKARPEVAVIEKDNGETPIHNLGSAVTVDDSALPKTAMTLYDLAIWGEERLGFFPGVTLNVAPDVVDNIAKHIIIADNAVVGMLEMLITEGRKEFEYVYNSLSASFFGIGLNVDKNENIEISYDGKEGATATVVRNGKRTVEIDIINKTVSSDPDDADECNQILERLNGISLDKNEKFKLVSKNAPVSVTVNKPSQDPKPAENKPATTAEVKPSATTAAPVDKPEEPKTVVVNNTHPTEVLCNTEQIVTRIDVKKIWSKVHITSFNKLNLNPEDKAHVMQRLEAAITAISADVKSREKYFGKAQSNAAKYGMMQKLYKSKDNFILTNGKRYWKFTEDGYSNFFDTLDEAVKHNGAEADKASA